MNIMLKTVAVTVMLLMTANAESLTLEEARTLALANSRSLAKYQLNIQSNLLDEKSQFYSYFPTLSLGANASIRVLNDDWSLIENPADTFSTGANLSLSSIKLFDGGKSLVQQAINKLSTESARKDALAEYFNVLDAADSAYYAMLEAAATLESEELALQTAATSLSMAEIRQAGGMISPGDYLKALADKESKEASRNQARRGLALSAAKLKALTGLGGITALEEIDFSGYGELIRRLAGISDDEANGLYAALWDILAASNPALAKAGLSGQRAEKNLSLAKRAYSPSVSASLFSTGINYSANNGFGTSVGGISISGSVPLDFWVIANNVKKSEIAREQAALDYISQQSAMEIELQTALLNVIAQAGSVVSSGRALEYAEKHFEYVMERYRLSQASVSDMQDAASLAESSRGQQIRARYGFLQSLSKLRSLGAVDEEQKLITLLMGEGA